MENRRKTGAWVEEILYASIERISQNVVDRVVQEVKVTFCQACPTPCNGWCNKAAEAGKALTSHYLIYKARWN